MEDEVWYNCVNRFLKYVNLEQFAFNFTPAVPPKDHAT